MGAMRRLSCSGHNPSGSWTRVNIFKIKIKIKIEINININKGERGKYLWAIETVVRP